MDSATSSTHDLHYNVILLGKTGSGKSASGNTILGNNSFFSKKSFKSVTQDVTMERVIINDVTLDVYDTPGLFNTETRDENVVDKWQPLLQLDKETCTVILLVMNIGRFTQEDKEAVLQIEDFIPERLVQNTWILFTRGDELESEGLTIEQFIEDTEELKNLVQKLHNRYHVFNNNSQSPHQVQTLIHKIKESARIIYSEIRLPDPEDPLHRRIVLVGKTGFGKSATGNTILRQKRFRSEMGFESVTSKTEMRQDVVLGRTVSVIDTPGLFDTTKSLEELSVEIGRSIFLSSPGPHAFLYIQSINIRFTEQEEDVIEKLEKMFGREMKKYTMILFTYGDQLEGKSVDMMIQKNPALSSLVNQCGGRYHIFNNKDKRNREQVAELLEKIDRMVEKNGGTCYSNEMYKEAARLRRKNNGFQEFYKKNKKYLLAAAAIGGGPLGGSVIGAIVGGVVAGPVGAGIGAGIGTGICLLVGTGIGTCAGVASCINAEENNERSESTDTQSAPDNDGGHESYSLYTFVEDTSESACLIQSSNIRQRNKLGKSQL